MYTFITNEEHDILKLNSKWTFSRKHIKRCWHNYNNMVGYFSKIAKMKINLTQHHK